MPPLQSTPPVASLQGGRVVEQLQVAAFVQACLTAVVRLIACRHIVTLLHAGDCSAGEGSHTGRGYEDFVALSQEANEKINESIESWAWCCHPRLSARVAPSLAR
jgi:hypothetical protein